jgi:hypothetical protein
LNLKGSYSYLSSFKKSASKISFAHFISLLRINVFFLGDMETVTSAFAGRLWRGVWWRVVACGGVWWRVVACGGVCCGVWWRVW